MSIARTSSATATCPSLSQSPGHSVSAPTTKAQPITSDANGDAMNARPCSDCMPEECLEPARLSRQRDRKRRAASSLSDHERQDLLVSWCLGGGGRLAVRLLRWHASDAVLEVDDHQLVGA